MRIMQFVDVPAYDEDGEESRTAIRVRHIVAIVKADGATRIDTVDGTTHYVAMRYEDVVDKLEKITEEVV